MSLTFSQQRWYNGNVREREVNQDEPGIVMNLGERWTGDCDSDDAEEDEDADNETAAWSHRAVSSQLRW